MATYLLINRCDIINLILLGYLCFCVATESSGMQYINVHVVHIIFYFLLFKYFRFPCYISKGVVLIRLDYY